MFRQYTFIDISGYDPMTTIPRYSPPGPCVQIDSCPVGSDITAGSRWKGIFYFYLIPALRYLFFDAWAGVSCLSSYAGGVLDRDSVYPEIVHSLLFSLCFPSSLLYWLQCNFSSDTYVHLIYSAPMVFLGRAVLTQGPPRPID